MYVTNMTCKIAKKIDCIYSISAFGINVTIYTNITGNTYTSTEVSICISLDRQVL